MEDVRTFDPSARIAPFVLKDCVLTEIAVVEGRLCQFITEELTCCLPCPMADWVYPQSFQTLSLIADWVAVASTICCAFLLLSWAALPVEKTNRHYLSVCLTFGVLLMNVSLPPRSVAPNLSAEQPVRIDTDRLSWASSYPSWPAPTSASTP